MKNTRGIILTILAVVSMSFGLIQQTKVSDLTERLEQTEQRALAAEVEATTQRNLAEEQRAAAERALDMARQSEAIAQAALNDCQKKKR